MYTHASNTNTMKYTYRYLLTYLDYVYTILYLYSTFACTSGPQIGWNLTRPGPCCLKPDLFSKHWLVGDGTETNLGAKFWHHFVMNWCASVFGIQLPIFARHFHSSGKQKPDELVSLYKEKSNFFPSSVTWAELPAGESTVSFGLTGGHISPGDQGLSLWFSWELRSQTPSLQRSNCTNRSL